VKVGDLIQSSAFVGQHGIIIEHRHPETIEGSWYHVAWLKLNRHYALSHNKDWGRHEWCRSHEIEPRDKS
jgi:hypothetical protein